MPEGETKYEVRVTQSQMNKISADCAANGVGLASNAYSVYLAYENDEGTDKKIVSGVALVTGIVDWFKDLEASQAYKAWFSGAKVIDIGTKIYSAIQAWDEALTSGQKDEKNALPSEPYFMSHTTAMKYLLAGNGTIEVLNELVAALVEKLPPAAPQVITAKGIVTAVQITTALVNIACNASVEEFNKDCQKIDTQFLNSGLPAQKAELLFASTRTEHYERGDGWLQILPTLTTLLHKLKDGATDERLGREVALLINHAEDAGSGSLFTPNNYYKECLALLNDFLELFGTSPVTASGTQYVAATETALGKLNERITDGSIVIKRLAYDESATSLLKVAQEQGEEALAYRYALIHGIGFIITEGFDYATQNTHGELELYDKATGTGVLTERYLEERAQYLHTLWECYGQDQMDYLPLNDGSTNFLHIAPVYYDRNVVNGDINATYVMPGSLINKLTIFGKHGGDTIDGAQWDAFEFHAFGGNGNDKLIGGSGFNYLEGGAGNDEYHVQIDSKADTIFDIDGEGDIYVGSDKISGAFHGQGERFYSANGKYRLTKLSDGSWQLAVKDAAGSHQAVALLQDWKNGQYGIEYIESEGIAPGKDIPQKEIDLRVSLRLENSVAYLNLNASLADKGVILEGGTKNDSFTGSGYSDIIITGGGTSHYVMAYGGSDYIIGREGREYIMAGSNSANQPQGDDDTVWGGANNDIIMGGGGNDVLWAEDGGTAYLVYDDASSFDRGDWISGGIGDDIIYGSRGKDVLFGGAGGDIIYGGAGADLILGDANYASSSKAVPLPYSQGGTISYIWNAAQGKLVSIGNNSELYASYPVSVPSGTIFNWEWSIDKNTGDYTFTSPGLSTQIRVETGAGNDILDGGLGNDWIAGQAGNDLIYGGEGDDDLYGDDVVPLGWGAEGDDILYAGDGYDRLYGGGGNDILDASDDDAKRDELYGGEGDDHLRGGTGKDQLYGEGGYDELYAGRDGSELSGGADSDLLFGGDGNDKLDGGTGEDWLVGSKGADNLYGGAGNDRFLFSISDLWDASTISTVRDAGYGDRLYLSGKSLDTYEFVAVEENLWVSRDGSLRLSKAGGLLIQAVDGDKASEGEIVVTGFQNGILGLNLPPYQPVTPNHPPEVADSIGNEVTKEDEAFSLVLPATLFADPDGDTLTYGATLADGSLLPVWLHFNAATRTLFGTPGNDDVGTLSIKITAHDGKGASASQIFDLEIENVNDAPEVFQALADQQGQKGQPFSFFIPANGFRDTDKDDTLSYSATLANGDPLPSWLSFNAAARSFNGTPGNSDIGSLAIRVTVTDKEGLSASDDFNLTITGSANHAPTASSAPAVTHTAKKGSLFTYTFPLSYFTDIDVGDSLSYSATLANGSPLPAWLNFNAATRTFSGTPGNSDTSALILKITATDLAGASASKTLSLLISSDGDDIFYGAEGNDGLNGNAGDDTLYGGEGDDVLRGGDVTILFQPGNDMLYGEGGNDSLYGAYGHDYLSGGEGNDFLDGLYGDDVMQGGNGHDRLWGNNGNDLMTGEAGDDLLNGQMGNDLLVGGQGNDTLCGDNTNMGSGNDLILFNKGDGQDTVMCALTDENGQDTLSLGGLFAYSDLALSKSGNDLLFKMGATDQITFKDWYANAGTRSIVNLQVIAEAMQGYQAGGSNPLLDQKVENFDFQGLVNAFDAARKATPTLTTWALTHALLDHQLAGSDTAALGGDLAYQYGKSGSFADIGLTAAQDILGNDAFGNQAQAFKPQSELQAGAVKLS